MKNFQKSLEILDNIIKRLEANTTTADKPVEKQEDQVADSKEKNQKAKQQKNTEKKTEGEGKPQKANKKTKTAPKELSPEEQLLELFSQADLRVGEIVECTKVEGSDKLYIEKISFGDETRQILSGLQPYVPIEQMKGKVVVFYNLKPRKLAGYNSEGMVMCNESKDKTVVELLRPREDAQVGERVGLNGQKLKLDEKPGFINSKNMTKFLEKLIVNSEGQAGFDKFELTTESGLVLKSDIKDGIIR